LRDLYLAGEYHLPIGKEVPVPTKSRFDREFLAVLNADSLDMDQSLEELYQRA
jgi:hypothetical protein